MAQPVSHPAEEIRGGEFSDDYRFTGVAYFGDAAAGIFGTSNRITLTDANGAGVLTVRDGGVGIGTSSPSAALDVASGNLRMNGNWIGLGDPDGDGTRAQFGIDGSSNVFIEDDSGLTQLQLDSTGVGIPNGNLDMSSNKITNLASPTSSGDAATKGYVDAAGGDVEVNYREEKDTVKVYGSSWNGFSSGHWETLANLKTGQHMTHLFVKSDNVPQSWHTIKIRLVAKSDGTIGGGYELKRVQGSNEGSWQIILKNYESSGQKVTIEWRAEATTSGGIDCSSFDGGCIFRTAHMTTNLRKPP